MKKNISKRKAPFFCVSKGLSNKQKIFFVSYTLQGDGLGLFFVEKKIVDCHVLGLAVYMYSILSSV